MAQHPGFDKAADDQECIEEGVELDQRAHPVVRLAGKDGNLAVAGLLERPDRQRLELEGESEARTGEHPAFSVENQRFREGSERRLGGDELLEPAWILHRQQALATKVVPHGQDVGADVLLMLVQIGLGHGEGLLQRRAHPLAEPRLDTEIEKQHRKHRDRNGRRHRHQAEQQDQPNMQP